VTILTALISAIVALLVSTVVFSWQRTIEQEFALRKEKCEIYRTFLSQVERAVQSRNAIDSEQDAARSDLWNTFHQIRLFGESSLTHDIYAFLEILSTAYRERDDPDDINLPYTDLDRPREKLLKSLVLDIENTEVKWHPTKALEFRRVGRRAKGSQL
jgi:hypothetical protein